eukprot:9482358-Pyramimonas_sp.AAC.3
MPDKIWTFKQRSNSKTTLTLNLDVDRDVLRTEKEVSDRISTNAVVIRLALSPTLRCNMTAFVNSCASVAFILNPFGYFYRQCSNPWVRRPWARSSTNCRRWKIVKNGDA